MTAMSLSTPDRKLTRADWDAMPEHRRKTELLDGVVVEMAAPTIEHQRMLRGLLFGVQEVLPAELESIFAPFSMYVSDVVILEPDLIVAPTDRFGPRGLEEPPTLVVEVLSPSTRSRDLVKKFNWFAQFGVPYVWFADPEEPSIVAFELVEGRYVEMGEAVGDQTLAMERPFPVSVNPRRLLES